MIIRRWRLERLGRLWDSLRQRLELVLLQEPIINSLEFPTPKEQHALGLVAFITEFQICHNNPSYYIALRTKRGTAK